MRTSLFSVITLLSDKKSFSLDFLDADFWFLAQFKDLNISRQAMHYRQCPNYYQREKTTYPLRKLRKQFANIAAIIDYFNHQNKEIQHFDLTFENGLRIRNQLNCMYIFYTSSTRERDALVNKFMRIAGFDRLDLDRMEINYSYYLTYDKPPMLLNEECPISPDEFWSDEAIAEWRAQYEEKFLNEGSKHDDGSNSHVDS